MKYYHSYCKLANIPYTFYRPSLNSVWIWPITGFYMSLLYQALKWGHWATSILYNSRSVLSKKSIKSAIVRWFPTMYPAPVDRRLSRKAIVSFAWLSAYSSAAFETGLPLLKPANLSLNALINEGLKVPWYQDRYWLILSLSSWLSP